MILAWFSDPNRTVQSDRVNYEPLINTILLTLRIGLYQKAQNHLYRSPTAQFLESWPVPTVWMVPYFPLNLYTKNLQKKKKNLKEEKETQLFSATLYTGKYQVIPEILGNISDFGGKK